MRNVSVMVNWSMILVNLQYCFANIEIVRIRTVAFIFDNHMLNPVEVTNMFASYIITQTAANIILRGGKE